MSKFPDFKPERVMFATTGDPEKDAEEAALIRRYLRNESEGLCPNGDAVMGERDADGVATCPGCGFVSHKRTLYMGK